MKLHRSIFVFVSLGLILGAAANLTAQEKLPPGPKVVRLEARPATVALKNPYDYSQLLLTATLDNGDRIDGTRMAQTQAPANLVKVSPTGLVRPVADGAGSLKFTLAGQSV